MSDLIPVASSTSKVEAGEFTRVEPPAAGQYWRLRRDLEKVDTKTASHPALPAGIVLLIKEIETQVDGTEHAVHLAAHPGWYEDDRSRPWEPKFLYDAFLDLWEAAPDGPQVRADELADLQNDMRKTQEKLLSPPPADRVDGVLAHDPSPNEGATGLELATEKGLRDMVAHAEATKIRAEKHIGWINRHTKTLGRLTYQMARHHQEHAEAMLAMAQSKMKSLDKVYEVVKNLKLYTGEDVTVVQVCEGEPAPREARLTFYQDLLAFDEELLIHLDDGGMDHRHINELPTILKDTAIADRLIPSPRGFVLCRFRSEDKEFHKTKPKASLAEAFGNAVANAEKNAIAKEKHLLYRDGERFYLITSEFLQKIAQLLPSTGEQNDYFHRARHFGDNRSDRDDPDYHKITPDDLDFAKAQRKQLGALNDYARVLVMCWGLHDRTELFETTAIPKFTNWLDPTNQLAFMALVSHDNLIGEQREGFRAYQRRMNEFLCAGATVIIDAKNQLDSDQTPGLFSPGSYRSESYLLYKPVDDCILGRVRSSAGRFYVEFTARYDGSNYQLRDQGKTITTKWFLDRNVSNFLVLDRLHAPDLAYYLTSRRQRREYGKYVRLFQQARAFVAQRDAEERPVRDILLKAVADGRLPHNPDHLAAAITAAIATWRTARGERRAALPGQEGWGTSSKALLNALHTALTPHDHRIAACEALARAQGREPLRLAHKGNDTWHLYATPIDEDKDVRLGVWPWIADIELKWNRSGQPEVKSITPRLLQKQSGELLLHEWPDAALHEGLKSLEGQSLKSMVGALDAAETIAARSEAPFVKPLPSVEWVAWATKGYRWSSRQKGNKVERPCLYIPIGTAISGRIERRQGKRRPEAQDEHFPDFEKDYFHDFTCSNQKPVVLLYAVDLWGTCYAQADAEHQRLVMEEAIRYYQNKESARTLLLRHAKRPADIAVMGLREFAPHADEAFFLGPEHRHVIEKDVHGKMPFLGNPQNLEAQVWRACQREKDQYGRDAYYFRITSLGPFGAEKFPELAAACDRPAISQSTTAADDANDDA